MIVLMPIPAVETPEQASCLRYESFHKNTHDTTPLTL
jgi:hypothetical protein